MITQLRYRRNVSQSPTNVKVEFSDDGENWVQAFLVCLEAKTLWPYIASDGNPYKLCREITNTYDPFKDRYNN